MLALAWLLVAVPALPPVTTTYVIDARLDPATRTVEADQTIRFISPADGPIDRLPLHLYLNGFAHEDTTYAREAGTDLDELLERHADPWGNILIDRVERDGRALTLAFTPVDDHNPRDQSLAEVLLDPPLLPGQTLELHLHFRAKLPVPGDRTGGERDYFLVGQWFPKLPVFETKGMRGRSDEGFVLHQFHGDTEFYGEFADYEVTLRAPPGWVLGATGVGERGPDGALRYRAERVIDFAWVAGTALLDEIRTVPRSAQPPLAVRYLAPLGREDDVARAHEGVLLGFEAFERRVGAYPYPALTVVLPPDHGRQSAGMEYPMLITGLPGDPVWSLPGVRDVRVLEEVALHELGHQWFYGLLATNEQEEAFLDEGFNTYWEMAIFEEKYGQPAGMGAPLGHPIDTNYFRADGLERGRDQIREPIKKSPSSDYFQGLYGAQVYDRPAALLATAARLFGTPLLDRVFAAYYARWAFRHPGLADFLAIAEETGSPALADFLREGFSRPEVPSIRAESLEVTPWAPPRGLSSTVAAAPCEDAPLAVWVHDPGYARPSTVVPGRVFPLAELPALPSSAGKDCYVSEALVSGPGWDELPIEIELRLAGGAVVKERWDGRAAWRSYRVVSRAPVVELRVDPADRLLVDPRRHDKGRRSESNHRFVFDWATFAGLLSAVIYSWGSVL